MQEQGEWRKKKETRQGKKKEGDCFTYSHPFAKVGAALLIRIDAIHRAKDVCVVMQVVCSAPCDVANI